MGDDAGVDFTLRVVDTDDSSPLRSGSGSFDIVFMSLLVWWIEDREKNQDFSKILVVLGMRNSGGGDILYV